MAAKKKVKGTFFDPERDERLRKEGGIIILSNEWDTINGTELMEILQLNHFDSETGRTTARVHRGMGRIRLMRIARQPERMMKKLGEDNPIDQYRDAFMHFFEEHWERIQDQVEINCPGDCYAHHDIQVLACFLANKRRLGKYLEN